MKKKKEKAKFTKFTKKIRSNNVSSCYNLWDVIKWPVGGDNPKAKSWLKKDIKRMSFLKYKTK